MKVRFLTDVCDKFDFAKVFRKDTEAELDDERAMTLENYGHVEILKDETEEAEQVTEDAAIADETEQVAEIAEDAEEAVEETEAVEDVESVEESLFPEPKKRGRKAKSND